jgi:alkanesulfonate monooxygenase SsuD/methylene tetrahydromethanopterin reductase-like flavin-dependent oxidoreductase (luciferase family)
MKYGLSLPTGGECGDPTFLVELARSAEEAGWDGLFLEDYVCYQGDPVAPTCDTWTVLAAIAMQTRQVVLGSSVTPLSRRRPWNVARQVAVVDQLSGGRAVLGVGLGDTGEAVVNDASLARFGEELDTRRRAEMLDESLEIIAGLWSGKKLDFKGRHYAVDGITFAPLPVQRPRVPIWVGGGYPNKGPVARALRWDGSILYKDTHSGQSEDMTPEDVRTLRELAGDRPFDIAVGGDHRSGDPEEARAHVAAMAEAGATWWIEWVPPADRATMRAAVDRGPVSSRSP